MTYASIIPNISASKPTTTIVAIHRPPWRRGTSTSIDGTARDCWSANLIDCEFVFGGFENRSLNVRPIRRKKYSQSVSGLQFERNRWCLRLNNEKAANSAPRVVIDLHHLRFSEILWNDRWFLLHYELCLWSPYCSRTCYPTSADRCPHLQG